MKHFCTYFDHNYIFRGLSLYSSLKKHCNFSFKLHILCLSDECNSVMSNFLTEDIDLISLDELEHFEPSLLITKSNRSKVEYYFTCTPILCSYIFHKEKNDEITYIDSDTYFFSSPEEIFVEIEKASVAIVPHRFSKRLQHLEDRGKYNVGWLTFKNDYNGRKCLKWYSEKCIEWCYDVVESNRFADQKYLDYFNLVADGVVEIKHLGLDLAPWNIDNYKIGLNHEGLATVNGQKLIMYHFERLKVIEENVFDTSLYNYNTVLSNTVKEIIYVPYIKEIIRNRKILNSCNMPHFQPLRYTSTDKSRIKLLNDLWNVYRKLKQDWLRKRSNSMIKL